MEPEESIRGDQEGVTLEQIGGIPLVLGAAHPPSPLPCSPQISLASLPAATHCGFAALRHVGTRTALQCSL